MADGAAPIAEDEGYSVATLRKQYLNFTGAKSAEIDEQRLARHYYHGDQFTKGELSIFKKRNQPPVTANRVGRKIDGVVGLVERMRQDPKAFSRTPQEENKQKEGGSGADVATAAIRYTLESNDWQPLSSEGARSSGINGIGGIELTLRSGDHGDPEVEMAQVDVETFFYDPRSIRLDFSDARFMGIAKWVDLEVAKELFPEKGTEIDNLISSGGAGESQQLFDREKAWVDTDEDRVFLIEHWYIKGGEWRFCFYVADEDLQSGLSPFKDERGKTFCRFLMFSSNVDHDGDRYGFVRNLKPLQDEVNARRSKGLHLLNTRRIIAEVGAVADPEKARAEAARPDGYVEVNREMRFEFDDQSKIIDMKGQIEFLTEAKTEIENFGFNPALLGTGVQDMSGRAIALQQQAGVAELGPFILAYRGWKIRVYRAVWNIVQQYWTSERWIRVTDDEGLAKYLQLNALQMGSDGQMTIANQLGALDVDIILDEGPDTITMMQDTYDTLTALASKGAEVPPAVLIELAPLQSPVKRKLLGMLQQASQGDPQKAAMEKEGAQAEIGATKAKGMKDFASAMKDFAEVGAMPEDMAHGRVIDHKSLAPQLASPEEREQVQNPPSVSINFKDMPPEAQSQALAEAGIFIDPGTLAAHADSQARMQASLKAQSRPQPARQ